MVMRLEGWLRPFLSVLTGKDVNMAVAHTTFNFRTGQLEGREVNRDRSLFPVKIDTREVESNRGKSRSNMRLDLAPKSVVSLDRKSRQMSLYRGVS
jgi:hypothetical protein